MPLPLASNALLVAVPCRNLAADAGVGAIDVGHTRLELESVRDAVAAGQRRVERVALDLAHVDHADQDRRDDRVADQRDAVARRIRVLQRRLEHALAFGRQHAGLLEDLRDHRRAALGFGRLPDRLGRCGLGWRGLSDCIGPACALRGEYFETERTPDLVSRACSSATERLSDSRRALCSFTCRCSASMRSAAGSGGSAACEAVPVPSNAQANAPTGAIRNRVELHRLSPPFLETALRESSVEGGRLFAHPVSLYTPSIKAGWQSGNDCVRARSHRERSAATRTQRPTPTRSVARAHVTPGTGLTTHVESMPARSISCLLMAASRATASSSVRALVCVTDHARYASGPPQASAPTPMTRHSLSLLQAAPPINCSIR